MMASVSGQSTTRVVMLGLGDELFAVDAAAVREILDPVPVTRVPGARDFAPGVINVRGSVIPLADLRVRFGMTAAAATADTRFLVLEIAMEGDPSPMVAGIVADKVYEVTEIEIPSPDATPRVGMSWPADMVAGIALWKGDFVVVPNFTAILN